jgi:hypothetical protein
MIDWLFRDRRTGKITIAQAPNAPLIIFMIAVAVRWAFRPSGTTRTVIDAVAVAALVYWAGDEVLRGVNPWRRGLGCAVLAALVIDHV